MMKRRHLLKTFVLGCLFAPVLSRAQSSLEKKNKSWKDLPEETRKKALENFQRFQNLSPEKQNELRASYQRFLSLSSQERSNLQRNISTWKKMSVTNRLRVQRYYARSRSLALRQKTHQIGRAQRLRFLTPAQRQRLLNLRR